MITSGSPVHCIGLARCLGRLIVNAGIEMMTVCTHSERWDISEVFLHHVLLQRPDDEAGEDFVVVKVAVDTRGSQCSSP